MASAICFRSRIGHRSIQHSLVRVVAYPRPRGRQTQVPLSFAFSLIGVHPNRFHVACTSAPVVHTYRGSLAGIVGSVRLEKGTGGSGVAGYVNLGCALMLISFFYVIQTVVDFESNARN